MIPPPLAPYAATVKLIAAGVLMATLIAGGWRVAQWRQGYLERDAAQAETARVARDSTAAMITLAEQHRVALAASQEYQDERDALRRAAADAGPAPVIRVCKPAREPAPAPAGGTPAGPDESAPATGGGEEAADFDTRPLFDLADSCDEISARLRALQGWVASRP